MKKSRRLDRIYQVIPSSNCKGQCQEACGLIACAPIEAKRMKSAAGGVSLTVTDDLTCGYLDAGGRCTVYKVRPVSCRLWGVVRGMTCPFGCEPERWVSPLEAERLTMAIHELSPGPIVHAPISDAKLERVREKFGLPAGARITT